MSDQDIEQIESEQTQIEREQLVAQWLLSTPGFFDRHPQLLTQMQLSNSHDGRVVSLQERQMEVLRNQNREINQRMSALLQFGIENDRTQHLMVKWLEALCSQRNHASVVQTITDGLNEIFQIGSIKYLPPEKLEGALVEKLQSGILIGTLPHEWALSELDAGKDKGSYALIALHPQPLKIAGLLFISDDDKKFTKEMGFVYLEQLGRLASAALSRFDSE